MNNLTKRLVLGTWFGLCFGLLCHYGFVSNPNMPEEVKAFQNWDLDNAMMWSTILNRLVLWAVVAMAWFFTIHPLFKFKIPVILRWIKVWLMISLLMAVWVLIWEPDKTAWQAFWMILWMWAFMWAVIDLIITKVAG